MAADHFAEQRRQMVQTQLLARGINDPRVLDAMLQVPRHLFVPPDLRPFAYEDHPLVIGEGQTISQPYMVGFMTQALDVNETDRVLEVGTGSGYQAAVLSVLAREVISIERNESLAEQAAGRLQDHGCQNVRVIIGDGSQGYSPLGPYDRILVTAAAPRVPESLKSQLKTGGRLVCPVGSRDLQSLHLVTRTDTGFETDTSIQCVFVPLVGHEGWARK